MAAIKRFLCECGTRLNVLTDQAVHGTTVEGYDEKGKTGSNRERMTREIIAQSAASHSNHFNQIEFLHSTTFIHEAIGQT
jgi:hypothetical protein